MDDGSAQEEKREQDQDCRCAGDDGTAQHLVDAEIDDLVKLLFLMFMDVFPDTVKDDDGVIDRVAGQGEQGGDYEQIHLQIQQPAYADDAEDIMQRGQHAGKTEPEIKSNGQIDNNSAQGKDDGQKRLVAQGRTDGRADFGLTFKDEILLRKLFGEDFGDFVADSRQHIFTFFDLDDQTGFVFNLLQIGLCKIVVVEDLTDLAQVKGFAGLVIKQ